MANRLTAHCSHGRGSAISTTSVVPSFGVPCHMPVSSAGRRSSCRTQTMTPFPSFECFRQPVFEPFRIVRHRLESPSAMQRLSPIPAVPVILDHASMMHAMHTPPVPLFSHSKKKRGMRDCMHMSACCPTGQSVLLCSVILCIHCGHDVRNGFHFACRFPFRGCPAMLDFRGLRVGMLSMFREARSHGRMAIDAYMVGSLA